MLDLNDVDVDLFISDDGKIVKLELKAQQKLGPDEIKQIINYLFSMDDEPTDGGLH
jgi:hypothetical protein